VPPARRTAAKPPPLTDDDVKALRDQLKAGDKPRVVVRAGGASVAAGTRGTVIRIGNPKDDEYIVVRLGRDEVPFAPAELAIPGRKSPSTPRAPRAKHAAASPRPAKAATPASSGPRLPAMVLTLRFHDRAWTLEMQRGSKQLASQLPLHPGAVNALAEHVDSEPVRIALLETVDAARSVIEAQAAALRAQLAETEAALAAYDAKPASKQP
jgi:hypothetical protein